MKNSNEENIIVLITIFKFLHLKTKICRPKGCLHEIHLSSVSTPRMLK